MLPEKNLEVLFILFVTKHALSLAAVFLSLVVPLKGEKLFTYLKSIPTPCVNLLQIDGPDLLMEHDLNPYAWVLLWITGLLP